MFPERAFRTDAAGDEGTVVPLYDGRPREPALVALSRHEARRRDVAAELGVSESTVARWEQLGMPHVRPFGPRGIVRYDVERCRAWRAARAQNLSRSDLPEHPTIGADNSYSAVI